MRENAREVIVNLKAIIEGGKQENEIRAKKFEDRAVYSINIVFVRTLVSLGHSDQTRLFQPCWGDQVKTRRIKPKLRSAISE